jgi:CheY-like chemotaxis protein
MTSPILTPWNALRVLYGFPGAFATLPAPQALVELLRWKGGSVNTNVWFVDVERACASTDPSSVDWTGFPEEEARIASRSFTPRRSGRFVRDAPPDWREALVLVVDDEPDHRTMMREALEDEGYRAETAVHGAEGLARIRAGFRPDIIILDLRMPVMDGWAFMTELKRDPELASIPVVVTTQAGDRVLTSAPVSAGYLAKPFEAHRLIETIQVCLSRRRRT